MTTRAADEVNAGSVPAGIDGLPALYEREAYLVHTLALRIACDPGAAADAVEQAFLELAAAGGVPAERAVAAALPRAAAASGGPITSLAGPLRAALAVASLCGEESVPGALQLPPAAARAVLERARRELAARLGVTEDEAVAAYAEGAWAAPPDELWPRVHAAAYRALAVDAEAVAEPERPAAPSPAARRRLARPAVFAAFGVLCAFGGAIAAVQLARPGSTVPQNARPAAAAPVAVTPDALTGDEISAQNIDELRMDELRDLKRYARQAADQDLAPQKRRAAGERMRKLAERAAARRRAAERRAAAKRRRALAEQRGAEPAPTPSKPRAKAPPAAPVDEDAGAVPLEDEPEPTPTPEDDQPSAERDDCLYDEENGVYVCPGD